MKKIIKLFVLFCFCAFIISGCSKNDTPANPLCRVVTRVDISCQHENILIQRHYTQNEKMESVLLYLRLLKPLGKPQTDPDSIDAEIFEITVHLSDGKQRIYRQKAHRYFSQQTRPWETIDPQQASMLYSIMRHLPSDTVFSPCIYL